MQIRPLRDRIAVRPDTHQGIASLAGLMIVNRTGQTDSKKQLGRTGTVIAVGPGKRDKKGYQNGLDLFVGARIAFGEFNYPKIHEFGEDPVLLMQEADVIGVISA